VQLLGDVPAARAAFFRLNRHLKSGCQQADFVFLDTNLTPKRFAPKNHGFTAGLFETKLLKPNTLGILAHLLRMVAEPKYYAFRR